MNFVITYKEYCEAMGETYNGSTPDWFYRIQNQAIETIRKEIVDVKIFPKNSAMLHNLKRKWLPMVIEGISRQIFYTYNNEYFLNNGVFANRSYSQTQYGEGPVTRDDYLNAINMICTPALNSFLETGWLCKRMDVKFEIPKYYLKYDPSYKDINWGQIGGNITDQADLIEYLEDNYTAFNDFYAYKSATDQSITNINTNIDALSEVVASKQDSLKGLATYFKDKYLHTNATTGELEWVDVTGTGGVTKDYVDTQDQAIKAYTDTKTAATLTESKAYTDAQILTAGKVNDVKVNGVSVVTDKVANISLINYATLVDLNNEKTRAQTAETALGTSVAGKISLLGNESGSGQPYHFPYHMTLTPTANEITAKAYTITLDNNKALTDYTFSLPAATTTTAGIMTAADKTALGNKLDKFVSSGTEKVYVAKRDGTQEMITLTTNDTGNAIVRRLSSGDITVPLNTAYENNATSKKYVDDKIEGLPDEVTIKWTADKKLKAQIPSVLTLKGTKTSTSELPTTATAGDVWFVRATGATTSQMYCYIDDTTKWAEIGSTGVDLSAYYTKTEANLKFEILANKTNSLTGKFASEDAYPSVSCIVNECMMSADGVGTGVTTLESLKVTDAINLESTAQVNFNDADANLGANATCATPTELSSNQALVNLEYATNKLQTKIDSTNKLDPANVNFTTDQSNALASGITSTKVGTYDGYATGKLDSTKCTYQETAPTAAISDNGVHIVYLTAEPTTKYAGYIYFIK